MERITIKEVLDATKGKLLSGEETVTILSVTTNSKNVGENALFIPLIGERADAHDYIDMAFDLGAVATLTSREQFVEGKVCIYVENTLKALQDLGAYYRSKIDIPIIGVTGSVGKTTTKEMIASVLETKYKVLKTFGNMNSQVGVPLMMFEIDSSYDIAVIEMGMSEQGEMEKLSSIVKPACAVITNIGVSHIAQLKSKSNIRKEKLDILCGIKDNGSLYICGNDDMLLPLCDMKKTQNYDTVDMSTESLEKLKKTDIFSYGSENTFNCQAEQIKTVQDETHFVFSNIVGTKESIVLSVLGTHNVHNGVVALALGEKFGILPCASKEGLKAYKPISMRGTVIKKNGITILDDTYNASPDSMKSGIEVLTKLEDGVKRRIAVLSDVLELGEHSYDCHYEVGEYIVSTSVDVLITVGNYSKAISKAVQEKKIGITVEHFEDNKQAILFLKEFVKDDDAILVKGSRGMHMEEIVEALCQSDM